MIQSLAMFALAALFEIGGCFGFWLWLRRGFSAWIAALSLVGLIGFAVTLTRSDTAFAGRAYAAYGGVYIATSLVWLWLIEGQRPTAMDAAGASLAVLGALVIIASASKG